MGTIPINPTTSMFNKIAYPSPPNGQFLVTRIITSTSSFLTFQLGREQNLLKPGPGTQDRGADFF